MGSEPKRLSFIFLFKSVFWDIYERFFYHLAYLIALSLFINTACSIHKGGEDTQNHSQTEEAQLAFYLVTDKKDERVLNTVSYMGQSLQLLRPAIISNEDIASVEPHSPTSLHLQLTPAGGEKLFAATSHHIGQRMLIMLDEKVINHSDGLRGKHGDHWS
ncbi:hypothetical protein [Shewanella atlantica]|uniref:Uncharacterized protein n=1 Tax=Shewanella atlantica TaxID=271099 RepID=A0A431WBU2_9GAMM|nr:hypothetical protein [Shewanella atlantica]RTR32829.1 hypothetical protein EKG39_10715 [Shewanella atlantica]